MKHWLGIGCWQTSTLAILLLIFEEAVGLACQRCIYNSSLPEGAKVRVYHNGANARMGSHVLTNTINCTLHSRKQKHVRTFDCSKEKFSRHFRKSSSRHQLMVSCSRSYTTVDGRAAFVRRDCSYGDCPNWSEEILRNDLALVYDEHDCCFIENCNNEKYMTLQQEQARIPKKPPRRYGRYPDDDDFQGSGLKGVRTYVVDVSLTTPLPPKSGTGRHDSTWWLLFFISLCAWRLDARFNQYV